MGGLFQNGGQQSAPMNRGQGFGQPQAYGPQVQPENTGFLSGLGNLSQHLFSAVNDFAHQVNTPEGQYHTSILGGGDPNLAAKRLQMGQDTLIRQQQAQQQQAELEMKQREESKSNLFAEKLKEIGISDPLDTIGNTQKALEAGAKNLTEASTFANMLAHNAIELHKAHKPDKTSEAAKYFQGADKQQYEIMTNPETGQKEARLLPGQGAEKKGRELTAGEIRANKTALQESHKKAKAAEKSIKELMTLREAYSGFDKKARSGTKSGSFISEFLPEVGAETKPDTRSKIIEHLLYPEEAREELHKANKVTSGLIQSKIAEAPAKNATDVLKRIISSGLAKASVLPEARKKIIDSEMEQSYKNVLEQQFFSDWSQFNNRDTDQTGAAFDQFVNDHPNILDQNGNPNRELLKEIPEYIKSYLGVESEEPQELSKPKYTKQQIEEAIRRRQQLGIQP